MLRPVLFIFYTVESIISILLMFFHIRGFLSQPLDFLPVGKQINHYFFSVSFYVFTVLTMFASINICTGKEVSIVKELIQSFMGFVLHIVISLMTLENAEHDFHIMYLMTIQNEGVEKAVHPFFEYMRSQAVCSLTCGVVYLLHTIIVIDVLLSGSDDSPERADGQESTDDYIPVRLYVFGERFQSHLEKYEWFNDFSRGNQNLL